MQIDYVLTFSVSGSSGKAKATGEKIKYLKKSGHSIRVLSVDNFSNLFTKNSIILALLFELRYVFKVIFSSIKPDLIITRSTICFGTYFISLLFRIPLIHEVHADFYDESKILFAGNRLKIFLSKLVNVYSLYYLKRSKGIIFNNSQLEEYYKNNYNLKDVRTICVHNGSDTEFFYPYDRGRAKEQLGLFDDKKYHLFIGSVSRWHGVEYLVETYNYLFSEYNNPDLVLLVVGGYNWKYLDSLRSKCKYPEHVLFTGQVTKEDAFYYINAADICLLPVQNIRISPGSPLKLFDYAACGKPIICQQDTVGYSDLVEKHSLGITCDFTNGKMASHVIHSFASNYNKRSYRENNRLVAEEYLSWEKVIEKWLDFGEAIVRKSR